MYKLAFYVPAKQVEQVKSAVFSAGAGKIGDYDQCCWQTLGEGQFRPLKGSQPFIGETGVTERIEEYRVEMVCDDSLIQTAVSALLEAHPYEEPAYDVWQLANI